MNFILTSLVIMCKRAIHSLSPDISCCISILCKWYMSLLKKYSAYLKQKFMLASRKEARSNNFCLISDTRERVFLVQYWESRFVYRYLCWCVHDSADHLLPLIGVSLHKNLLWNQTVTGKYMWKSDHVWINTAHPYIFDGI